MRPSDGRINWTDKLAYHKIVSVTSIQIKNGSGSKILRKFCTDCRITRKGCLNCQNCQFNCKIFENYNKYDSFYNASIFQLNQIMFHSYSSKMQAQFVLWFGS